MAREKPNAWECEHPLPIEVVPFGEGRRARCLVCGLCGPERPDTEEALWALRGRRAAGRGSAPEGSQPPNFALRGFWEVRIAPAARALAAPRDTPYGGYTSRPKAWTRR